MKKVAFLIIVVLLALPWFLKGRSYYTTVPRHYVDDGPNVLVHCPVLGRKAVLFAFPSEEVQDLRMKGREFAKIAQNPNVLVARDEEQAARLRAREFTKPTPRVTTTTTQVSRQGGVISESSKVTGGAKTVVVAPPSSVEKVLDNGMVINATAAKASVSKTVKLGDKTYTVEVRWNVSDIVSVAVNDHPIGEATHGTFLGIPIGGTEKLEPEPAPAAE